jgi:hypothetical protein
MTFFKIVALTLIAIAFFNLIQVAVEMAIRSQVYACSSLNKYDPSSVKKLCRK